MYWVNEGVVSAAADIEVFISTATFQSLLTSRPDRGPGGTGAHLITAEVALDLGP